MTRLLPFALFALCLHVPAAAADAQAVQSVTQADVRELQDSVYLAERDVLELQSRNASLAAQLQRELDDLRDETIYLRVKLRKEGTLTRGELSDVEDRIDRVRSRARGDEGGAARSGDPRSAAPAAASPPPAPAEAAPPRTTLPPAERPASTVGSASPGPRGTSGSRSAREIPAGTELDVRLQHTLNSGTAQVEDRFEGTTIVDLTTEGRTLIPAGSVVRGVVSAVEPASRTNRTARLSLSFDELVIDGVTYDIRGTLTEAIEGEGIRGEAGRIGAGAGVGAIIGGILGGFKGALAGILIGGGGVIAATEGKEVELPQGTVLRVRIDAPVDLAR